MKQQQAYFEAVRAWDSKHRIVGKTPIEQLISESKEALASLPKNLGTTLIDVGAGAGVLGFPWLWLSREHKAVFVEPDSKKAAFLTLHMTSDPSYQGRARVICAKFENVPRETLKVGAHEAFLAARAFSGAVSLVESIQLSQFVDLPAFDFVAEVDLAKKISVYSMKAIDLSK